MRLVELQISLIDLGDGDFRCVVSLVICGVGGSMLRRPPQRWIVEFDYSCAT